MLSVNTPRGNYLFPERYLSDAGRAWRAALSNRVFRVKLLLIPGIFILYAAITQPLGDYVELRKGIRLDDTLLSLVPVVDCSALIFSLLYSSLIMVIATHLNKPRVVMRIMEMHILFATTRQLCILLIPLEPPAGMLLLRDVFLENTVYPHHVPMTKDLFFSGHVASLWTYFLCAQRPNLKIYLGFATALMSMMLLSMRVHYTYDLYGAIAATTIIYTITYGIKRPGIKAVYLRITMLIAALTFSLLACRIASKLPRSGTLPSLIDRDKAHVIEKTGEPGFSRQDPKTGDEVLAYTVASVNYRWRGILPRLKRPSYTAGRGSCIRTKTVLSVPTISRAMS